MIHPLGCLRSHLISATALFAGAFFLRLFLAPFPGHVDVKVNLAYGQQAVEHGVVSVADLFPESDAMYPPLFIYQYALVSHVGLGKLSTLQEQYPQVAEVWTRVRYKLVAIGYDLLTAAVILWVVARATDARMGLLGAAAYLFNPCVFINSAFYGQVDSIHSFFALLALLLMAQAWVTRGVAPLVASWVVFGLAVCVKLQSIVFIPLLVFASFFKGGMRKTVGGVIAGILTVLLLYLPFILANRWDYLRSVFYKSFALIGLTQFNAFNLWSLVYVRPSSEKLLGLISYGRFGLLLASAGVLWYSLCLWRQSRVQVNTATATRWFVTLGAYAGLAAFLLLTGMHERYIAPAIAPLILAAALDRRLRWLAAGFSLTYTLNLLLVLKPPLLFPGEVAVQSACLFAVRTFSALLNLAMFAWFTARLPSLIRLAATEDKWSLTGAVLATPDARAS